MNTLKGKSDYDNLQTLGQAFNDVDSTITTNGFLVGLVGRKVTVTISTTTSSNDTQSFSFSENGTPLYTLTLIFTDSTYSQLLSAERTA
jgi:hypothetical protein